MLHRQMYNSLLRSGDYQSAKDLGRFVLLRNAHLVHRESYADYEDHSRNTNLAELVSICHRLSRLFTTSFPPSPTLSQFTDKETRVVPYPQHVLNWDDLPALQGTVWTFLDKRNILSDSQVFPSEFQCSLVKHSIHPISSSRDVYSFRHQTVHRFLRLIWSQLLCDDTVISSCLREVYDCLADPCGISTSTLEFELEPNSADCRVFLYADRHEFPIFFVHYLSAEELPKAQLKELSTKFSFATDVLSGGGMESPFIAAVLRAYAQMLSTGCRSSLVDTGEALVFLQVDGTRPDVLRMLKYMPTDELEEDPDNTVVAQYLTFALLSLQDMAPSQEWYDLAAKLPNCILNSNGVRSLSDSADYPSISPNLENIPTPMFVSNEADRPFCTLKCLLSLSRDEEIDQNCPNAQYHGDEYHETEPGVLLSILYNQLARSTQPYVFRPIHLHGEHHHYLKGTIPGYGYTFLVKAVEASHVKELEAEFEFYQRMPNSQGFEIPVCLGMIDLKECIGRSHTYYGKEFEKMLLLSCSGVSAVSVVDKGSVDRLTEDRKLLESELNENFELAALDTRKVDLSWSNLVWNQQEERLVLINFLFWDY